MNQKIEVMDNLEGQKVFSDIDHVEEDKPIDAIVSKENDTIEALTFAAERGFKEYLELEIGLQRLPDSDGIENEKEADNEGQQRQSVALRTSILLEKDCRGVTPLHVLGCQDHDGEEGMGMAVERPKPRGRRKTQRDFCGRRRTTGGAEDTPAEPPKSNRAQIAELMIIQGADVMLQTTKGLLTPLHCHCYYGHMDVVKILLASCEDMYAQANMLYMASNLTGKRMII